MKLKEEIRNKIIEQERELLMNMREVHKMHTNAADLDEDSSLSNEDFAQQDQSRESAKGIETRITQNKIALDTFVNLDHSPKTKAEPGALVLTNTLNFYIGIASSVFEYQGKNYIGLDVNAPIYSVLNNAEAGSEISFNGKKYEVLQIL